MQCHSDDIINRQNPLLYKQLTTITWQTSYTSQRAYTREGNVMTILYLRVTYLQWVL